MIIVKICGGLGNQMYQKALIDVLKIIYPTQIIKVDITHYNILKEHNGFELNSIFEDQLEIATSLEIKMVNCAYLPNSVYKLCEIMPYKVRYRLAHNINKYGMLRSIFDKEKASKRIVGYGHNIYNDLVFHLDESKDYYLDGLWQNVAYFENYSSVVLKSFSFKDEFTQQDEKIAEEMRGVFSVSIHIRRGDFLNSMHDICGEKYYYKAIDFVEKRFPNIKKKYFIFSDDKEYVQKVYSKKLENVEFVQHSGDKSYLDMRLMSLCKVNIIANSTFSFWGAYLNTNSVLTVAPAYTIRTEQGKHTFSVPKEWVIIDPYTEVIVDNSNKIL